MTRCFDEVTYSVYVDGELSEREAQRVTAHLANCGRCRGLVGALREESVLLAEALQRPEPAPSYWLPVMWTAAIVVVSGIIAGIWDGLLDSSPPAGLEWLSGAPKWEVLFSGGFYLAQNGREAMVTIISFASTLLVIALVGTTVWMAVRRATTAGAALITAMLLMAFAGRVEATERRRGQNVVVQAGETVSDTLVIMAESAAVEGTVEGDVVAFVRQATVRGLVRGNLMCFCRTLEVEGRVEGNVQGFAQSVNVRGQAARNIYAFAQNVTLAAGGQAGENLTVFAAEVELHGDVGRDAVTFTESANVRGSIGRDLRARAERISLAAPARVGGDLIAHVHDAKNLRIGEGVTIRGKTETRVRERRSRYARPFFWIWQGIQLGAAWVTGMLLGWLAPAMLAVLLASGARMAQQLGKGFLLCVATPIAAAIVAITLVGLPLALITLALWLVAIYLAKVFVGAAIGRALLGPRRGGLSDLALFLLIGLLIIFVLTNLPYIGKLFTLVVVLWGLGMAFERVRAMWPRETLA